MYILEQSGDEMSYNFQLLKFEMDGQNIVHLAL